MVTLSSLIARAAQLRKTRAAVGLGDYKIGWTTGRRYFRMYWSTESGARSVIEFIDCTTGDVYRADSWKKRGRNLRFSITS